MISLSLYILRIYSFIIFSFLLNSYIWTDIVISEDKISFVCCDVDPPITWFLNYSCYADYFCQDIDWHLLTDDEKCIYRNMEHVFIKSVSAISLTIKSNSTQYRPRGIAFIVHLDCMGEPENCNTTSLFVFQDESKTLSGESNMYAFHLPEVCKEKKEGYINYEFIYEDLTALDMSVFITKTKSELDNLVISSCYKNMHSSCPFCYNNMYSSCSYNKLLPYSRAIEERKSVI